MKINNLPPMAFLDGITWS